ncbi:MAG: glycosyltransferase [Planctomycetota bacterium]
MTGSDPIVSVVIPAYGHAQFLPRTIQSVLDQTFDESTEIIVVDDGSPDDTAGAVEPFGDRVRLVRQKNGGQGSARNKGISLAQGEFVAMLDDDDLFTPDKLQWQVEAMRHDPGLVLVYGEDDRIDADDKPVSVAPRENYRRPTGDCHRDFLVGCWIATPGQTLIRRSALAAVGGYDETIWGSDDWELYIRLSEQGPFHYDPRVALHYRVHPGNHSGNILRHFVGHQQVIDKHPSDDPAVRTERRESGRAYFLHNLMQLSHAARLRGDLATSLEAQRYAAHLDTRVRWRQEWWKPHLLNRLGIRPKQKPTV